MENNKAQILWDFQNEADRHVLDNRLDIMIIDKNQKTVIDVADVKWQQHQEGLWEAEELLGPEGGTENYVESKGECGTCSDKSIPDCNS